MSQGTVLEPTITLGTAYLVITPEVVLTITSVKTPTISIGAPQTITPPVVS